MELKGTDDLYVYKLRRSEKDPWYTVTSTSADAKRIVQNFNSRNILKDKVLRCRFCCRVLNFSCNHTKRVPCQFHRGNTDLPPEEVIVDMILCDDCYQKASSVRNSDSQ